MGDSNGVELLKPMNAKCSVVYFVINALWTITTTRNMRWADQVTTLKWYRSAIFYLAASDKHRWLLTISIDMAIFDYALGIHYQLGDTFCGTGII